MIEFGCKNCGQKLSVQDQYSGKRVKCPKCGSVGVVPDNSDKIKFHCDSCGQSISVPQIHAGKKGKCPKCKTSIIVPSPKREPAGSAASGPSIPSGADEDLYEDESDLPEEDEGLDRRLILVICGTAAVVVVGLIIFVAVVLPSGSKPVEEPDVSPRQEVATQPTGTSTQQPPKENVVPKEPAQSSAAASDNARNLDLKLRLKHGQKHKLQIIKETSSSETIEGRQSDGSFINTMGLGFEVKQVDPNGVTWLKVTYLTIHDVAKTARGHMEYDSTKPSTATNRSGGSLFSAMIGQSFVAKVTPEGEIVELEGLAEMYLRMAEPIVKQQEEDIRRRAKGRKVGFAPIEKRIESRRKWLEMNSRTGEKAIREMLGNVIMPFPGGPVGIGDSWQARTALYSMGVGTLGLYDCTYTLRETEQAAVLVDISSKIEVDDEQPIPGADGSSGSLRTTLAGSCKGSLEIDPSSGWMLHKNVTIRYSGELKTAPTERTPQGATMGMSMEIVTTVKPME
jgi:DNA-directed RNA polymerase subunit RPC12/RpoP